MRTCSKSRCFLIVTVTDGDVTVVVTHSNTKLQKWLEIDLEKPKFCF